MLKTSFIISLTLSKSLNNMIYKDKVDNKSRNDKTKNISPSSILKNSCKDDFFF